MNLFFPFGLLVNSLFHSSPLARLVFPPTDDNILRFLYDDNQRVEPEWYMPIIPMVLINGAEGIGTGWSCKIPNFDIREVVNNIRRLMDGEEPLPMVNNVFKSYVWLVSLFSTYWSVSCKRFKTEVWTQIWIQCSFLLSFLVTRISKAQ